MRALAQCRGTNCLEVRKLSRYIGALLRADARVRVQDHYEVVLGAGAKAKSVTSLLTLPSVLAAGLFFMFFLIFRFKVVEMLSSNVKNSRSNNPQNDYCFKPKMSF